MLKELGRILEQLLLGPPSPELSDAWGILAGRVVLNEIDDVTLRIKRTSPHTEWKITKEFSDPDVRILYHQNRKIGILEERCTFYVHGKAGAIEVCFDGGEPMRIGYGSHITRPIQQDERAVAKDLLRKVRIL